MPAANSLSARPGFPHFARQPDRACLGTDTNLFFSDDRDEKAAAKAICFLCPYRTDCETWAVDHNERGIWGGTDDGDRARRGQQRNAKTRTVVCACCATEFTTNQPCAKFCSTSCADEGRKRARQEKKETRQPAPGPVVNAETNADGAPGYDPAVVERLVTGQTPFRKAAKAERLEAIRQLAAAGAGSYDPVVVERLVTGQMPLRKAAKAERLEAIRQLAAAGLSANTIRQLLHTSGASTRQILTQATTEQQPSGVKAA